MHAVIVVPCYNEEHRLDTAPFRNYTLAGHRVEFCFVNDGSRDGTLALLEQLRASNPGRFFVVSLERNSGKAEAVRRGIAAMMERKPDLVGFWDADLATPLTELEAFLEILERREIEMVLAARVRLLGRSISRRPSRHYVGRIGATLISQTLSLAVYDTQCGAKLFRVNETMREIFSRPFLSRWLFDVEILARFVERRGRAAAVAAIYELPIQVWHDVQGSKVKSADFLKALRDLWKIRRAYRIQR